MTDWSCGSILPRVRPAKIRLNFNAMADALWSTPYWAPSAASWIALHADLHVTSRGKVHGDDGAFVQTRSRKCRLDSDLDRVVQIQDAAQRNQLLSDMQKRIVDSASTIFCIAPDLVMPVRKEWAHVKYDPFFQDGIIRWFYWSKGS